MVGRGGETVSKRISCFRKKLVYPSTQLEGPFEANHQNHTPSHVEKTTPSLHYAGLLQVTVLTAGVLVIAPSLHAQTTLLSQNFDTSPVNYTGSAFQTASSGSAYYNLFNSVPEAQRNTTLTGNTTNFLTAQDLNNPNLPAPFSTSNPARIDFSVNGANFENFTLTLDLAGGLTPESINYIRAFTDNDGDGTYETTIFDFKGTENTPYVNALNTQQALTLAFQNFSFNLATPTAPNTNVRLRFELFNDSTGTGEVLGLDNIVISGTAVPEPTTLVTLVGGVALLGMLRRRRLS
jgi:hypothetical protein